MVQIRLSRYGTKKAPFYRVVVAEKRRPRDGRFIPGLDVTVTVSTADGEELGSHPQRFLWHPWLHHYGRNWTLPGDGSYDIAVHIRPAEFMRHDKENGARFAQPVEVEFKGVEITTGQK